MDPHPDGIAQAPAESLDHALRESERRLRESEATLRAFYESSPACMGITELVDGDDILHIHDNPATCRFFGIEPGATAGRRARAELRADPNVLGSWIHAYREAEAHASPVKFEHEYRTHDGARWLAATVMPLGAGPSGRTRFAYVAEDVTARKLSHDALRDSEQRLRLALDAGRMGTWEWHVPTGRVTWSEGLERIHGYEPGTFPGTVEAYAAEVHPDDKARVEQVIANTFAGHEHRNEYRIVRRDGAVRWVEGVGKLFHDDEGQPLRLVGVCTDVTERKDAEARLRESEEGHRKLAEALREADRRKDQFLATLAHELRNPLAPLRSGVEVLQRTASDRPDVARLCAMMERQLRHMVRLVDDLLDVSRITRGKVNLQRSVIDLERALQDAIETSRTALEARQHALATALPAEPVRVDGDAMRLSQVFANLLHNAAKFTQPGGHIEVRLQRTGDEAIVSVQDDGVGIDAAMLDRVFELFTQLEGPQRGAQGGLGIGLTLARELVELHGGRLVAESDGPGKGSRFIVRLPLAPGDAKAPPESTSAMATRELS